jgi:hypothetical protein
VSASGQGNLQGVTHCSASRAGIAGLTVFGALCALTNLKMPGLSFASGPAVILVGLVYSAAMTAPSHGAQTPGRGN